MIDHDRNVGEMLEYIDELDLTENTFVMYYAGNGPQLNRPDGAMTPLRREIAGALAR